MTRRRFALHVLALFVAGAAVRVVAAGRAAVIERDGIAYLDAAGRFAAGDWRAGIAHFYPPGLPLLLAAGHAGAPPGEWLAARLVALASALAVPAAALLASRAAGPRAGLFAGATAALLPLPAVLGSEVLADGPFAALALGALAAGQRALEGDRPAPAYAAVAGVLACLAYLFRPEGLVVLGALAGLLVLAPRPRPAGRRLLDLAGLLVPGLLAVVVPYVLWIRDLPVAGGAGAGAVKLTLKRDLAGPLGALDMATYAANVVALLGDAAKGLGPALPLVALAPFLRPRRAAAGRLLLLVGVTAGLHLAACAAFRADWRYGAAEALLLAPAAGLGLLVAGRRVEVRRPGWRRAVPLAAVLALAAAALPVAWRPRRGDKAGYRAAGAWLRARGAGRVLAFDARAAFYAGAEPLHLQHLAGDASGRVDAARWAELAARADADAIVLRVDTPERAAVARRLAARLGAEGHRVAVPGAVALLVLRRP